MVYLQFTTIRTEVQLLSAGPAQRGTAFVPQYRRKSQVMAVLPSCARRAVSQTRRASCCASTASRFTITPTGRTVRSPRSRIKPTSSALRRRRTSSKLKKNKRVLVLGQRESEVVPNPLPKKVRQQESEVVPNLLLRRVRRRESEVVPSPLLLKVGEGDRKSFRTPSLSRSRKRGDGSGRTRRRKRRSRHCFHGLSSTCPHANDQLPLLARLHVAQQL